MLCKKHPSKLKCRSIVTRRVFFRYTIISVALYACFFVILHAGIRQPNLALTDESSNAKLLDDYVKAKGSTNSIIFDSSNIKQFWVEESVSTMNKTINIFLDNKTSNIFEGVPLRIQLANVNESQNCTVEVIADSSDVEFAILNNKSLVLSKSSTEQPFVQYHIISSTIHLEDTPDYSFSLKFTSRINEIISIRKIILSFSNNPNTSFLTSPGILKIKRDGVDVSDAVIVSGNYNDIEFKGKQGKIKSKKNIIISSRTLETSVKVKNIGDAPTHIYIGFALCSKDRLVLDSRNYPYNSLNNILTVVSSEAGSNKVIVDSYSDWAKNCHLALNAKKDLLDVPNTTFADGRIIDVKKLDDGKAEITMDKPFKEMLEFGTKVRIHGIGGGYLYTNYKLLQPNEEEIFVSSFKKDDFSSNGFSKGVYYVKPLILSHSVDANKDNTVVVSDYSISY